jgi:hypothetical protein
MPRQTRLATQAQTVADAIADLQGELEGLVVNASACGLKSRIELLTDLRARHVTAEKDLPDRRLRLGLAEQTVARILARINHGSETDPGRLILSTAVTGPLRDLMEQRSGVEAAVAAAETEVEKARDALSEAAAKIGEDDGGLDEAARRALAAAIGTARQSDDTARLRAADRIRQERADEFDDRLIELRPWDGGRDALLAVPVPTPDQLEHWASTEAELARDIALQQGELDRLSAEGGRLDGRIEALSSTTGAISDQEAGDARSARETAWAVHKGTLTQICAASRSPSEDPASATCADCGLVRSDDPKVAAPD